MVGLFAVGLLIVLRPDREDDNGSCGKERPDEEADFADAGGAFGGFIGDGVWRGLIVLVGEERVVFGRLFQGISCCQRRIEAPGLTMTPDGTLAMSMAKVEREK